MFWSSDSYYNFSKRGGSLSMVAPACNPVISERVGGSASLWYTGDLFTQWILLGTLSQKRNKKWNGKHNLALLTCTRAWIKAPVLSHLPYLLPGPFPTARTCLCNVHSLACRANTIHISPSQATLSSLSPRHGSLAFYEQETHVSPRSRLGHETVFWGPGDAIQLQQEVVRRQLGIFGVCSLSCLGLRSKWVKAHLV